ncbi:MAG: hypothetical protein OXC61_11415, partial [Flavobacteriaceae bacterium]|nr:hypothetical protein [Flavobacteriaceae bacterium]
MPLASRYKGLAMPTRAEMEQSWVTTTSIRCSEASQVPQSLCHCCSSKRFSKITSMETIFPWVAVMVMSGAVGVGSVVTEKLQAKRFKSTLQTTYPT